MSFTPKALLGCTAAGLALTAMPAFAQGTAEMENLRSRIDQLEQRFEGPDLSFGTGTGTTITFEGYVKADFIFDLDTDLGNTIFSLGTLDPDALTGEDFRAIAYQSRIGIRTATPTALGEMTTRIEGDFYGDGGGGFRLRHAYGELGGLLVGQTWSTFMPIESYPGTLDFQGPAGISFLRPTQLRYSHDFTEMVSASIAIEEAAADSDSPALAGAVSYDAGRYFLKASAVYQQVDTTAGDVDGYGLTLSGNAELWRGGSIDAAYTIGEGIASYMVFPGDDAVVTGGDAQAVETEAVVLGLTQEVGETVTLGAIYGWREDDIGAPEDAETIETLHLGANVVPVEGVTYGIEYIAGEKTQFDDRSVDIERVQASVRYDF